MFGNDPGRGIGFFLFCAGCLVALSVCVLVLRTFKVTTIHWGIAAAAVAACLALAYVCVAISASISAAV
jgi:hypothetical protein